jgi:predicted GNAT superfamily acetyltransferase
MDQELKPIIVAELETAPALEGALLALNNAHAVELSWLEPHQLRHLVGQAFLARRVGEADALLLAVDQDADYDSPNFLWHRARFDRFVYVDRVVVAEHARGRRLARRLYVDLFERARSSGHEWVVCEVNARPPNPASDAFHAVLGFETIGQAEVYDGAKTVTYLAKRLGLVDLPRG